MLINFHIDPELKTEKAEFWLQKMTDHISDVTSQLNQDSQVLWCYSNNNVVPINYSDIIAIHADGNAINVATKNNSYQCKFRLVQIYDQLSSDFIEASRDTIINYKMIDHLELLDNGKIDVLMINKQRVQISRRKIKNLKERLGI